MGCIASEMNKNWKMVKFGDIVRQRKETVERDNNPFKYYVKGGHMDSEHIHIRRWGKFGSDYIGPAFHRVFRQGQVLYGSRRTYLKKVVIADFDGITANTTFVCETKDQNIFMQELLPFLMLTDSFTEHSIRESKGSTNPYINWSDIAKYEFLLPPLDEQKRITEILWAADEASGLFVDAYTHCETMQRALIDSLIAQKNSKWNYAPLRKLIHGKPQYGANAPACEFKEHGFRYIRITDIDSNGFLNQEEKVGINMNNSEAKKYLLEPGDVLFARTGTVGKFYLHSAQKNKCIYAGYLVRFKLKNKKILPDYLFLFTRSKYYEKWIYNTVRIGVQPNINGQEYASLPILVLPIDMQMQLIEKFKKIESVKEKILNHISNIKVFTKTFMNRDKKMESSNV